MASKPRQTPYQFVKWLITIGLIPAKLKKNISRKWVVLTCCHAKLLDRLFRDRLLRYRQQARDLVPRTIATSIPSRLAKAVNVT